MSRLRSLILVVVLVPGLFVGASSPVAAQQPESANVSWLRFVYVDTLGRAADSAGIDFWLGRLAGGGARTREDVVRGFVYSPEGSAVEVQRAYADLLARQPEAGGAAFWTDYLQDNPVIILRANLISSDEYFQASGSTSAWLSDIYQVILGRSIDSSGATYWTEQLNGGQPRWQVVLALYLSDESLGVRADAYAIEILGRVMSPAERAEAVALIRAKDERALRARLLASDEAFEPFLEAVGLATRNQLGDTGLPNQ